MTAAAPRPFPLVPRRRFLGVQFGRRRTSRRGDGDEIAGTRPYQPGDLTAHIHWAASARLSEARGTDEFVVREFFAEQAPRVALVTDRRRAMGVRPSSAPWLDKRLAAETAARLIAASALAEQGEVALSDGSTRGATWLRGPGGALAAIDRRAQAAYDGNTESMRAALDAVVREATALPSGSFVFVVSDFLNPVPTRVWARLRALRWDVTPVVVQDPVWETSFPDVGGAAVPLADPETGRVEDVWFSPRAARERAAANEARLASLLGLFGRLGFDPVLLDTADPAAIDQRFHRWAERRRRSWRSHS
jgi:uncharacterized protein (DUF58 family)